MNWMGSSTKTTMVAMMEARTHSARSSRRIKQLAANTPLHIRAGQFAPGKSRQAAQTAHRDQQKDRHFGDDNPEFEVAVGHQRRYQAEPRDHHPDMGEEPGCLAVQGLERRRARQSLLLFDRLFVACDGGLIETARRQCKNDPLKPRFLHWLSPPAKVGKSSGRNP